MLLKDVLTFRDDLYFEGAVQSEWFYDRDRVDAVASSFVFHGPATHAVTGEQFGGRALMDTASFALRLAEKADDADAGKPFTLAIAGYGTGKSHLNVALSVLLSGESFAPALHARVMDNLRRADPGIADQLLPHVRKPRLVLTLNGMRDFNLHYELLRTAQKSLTQRGADLTLLDALDKSRDIALHFVEHSFDTLTPRFEAAAAAFGRALSGQALRAYLLDELVDSRSTAFGIIDRVYTELNGHAIRRDEGVSASAVLDTLLATYCGPRRPFDGIVLLFDEFGRYLEYAADEPAAAGDSALQQIFESVQNAQGGIQFVGFIQSDIRSYLKRVEKSGNISRYIDRYDAGEKIYLSSNLETVFANLLEKKDRAAFDAIVQRRFQSERDKWDDLHERLSRQLELKGVWRDRAAFKRLILTEIYPLHPISTYLLCYLTDYLQNRSSLTLLSEKLHDMEGLPLDAAAPLPLIRPVDLIDGAFFEELLSAEEQGRQRTQFCILLNNILRRDATKLSRDEIRVLYANLILRICRFHFESRDELNAALCECAGLTARTVADSLAILENEYACLSFDERAVCLDFVADSVGAGDFRNFLRRACRSAVYSPAVFEREEIAACAALGEPLATAFSSTHGILTGEWCFEQRLALPDNIGRVALDKVAAELANRTEPNKPKGLLIWVYAEKGTTTAQLERLEGLLAGVDARCPLLFFLLDDARDELKAAIMEYRVLLELSADDRARYHRFYDEALDKAQMRVGDLFAELKQERKRVMPGGIIGADKRMNLYLAEVFEAIYPKALPFDFDGFQAKSLTKAKKLFCSAMKWTLSEKPNESSLKTQSVEVRNRIDSSFGPGGRHSWKSLSPSYNITIPMNGSAKAVYLMLEERLRSERRLDLGSILRELSAPPYGMNDYAAFLMLALLIQNMAHTSKLVLSGETLGCAQWTERVVEDKDLILRTVAETTLYLRDAASAKARFKALFSRIHGNMDMTQIAALTKALDDLEREESCPEELSGDYGFAQMRLTQGKKAMEAFSELRGAIADDLINASRREDSCEALKAVQKIRKYIENNREEEYRLTDEQLIVLDQLSQKARMLGEKHMASWLPRQRCQGVGEISRYQKTVRYEINLLTELGYVQQAQKLRALSEREAERIDILTKRASLLEDTKSYLSSAKTAQGLTLKELVARMERGKMLIKIFDSFDHSNVRELEALDRELREQLSALDKMYNSKRKELNGFWQTDVEPETLDDLRSSARHATALLSSGLEEKDRRDLEDADRLIRAFLDAVDSFAGDRDDRDAILDWCDELERDFADAEEVVFTQVIEDIRGRSLAQIDEREVVWVETYLTVEPEKLDADELLSWLEETRPVPKFVTEEKRIRHTQLVQRAEAVQAERRIEAIVALFRRLEPEEQVRCLEALRASM